VHKNFDRYTTVIIGIAGSYRLVLARVKTAGPDTFFDFQLDLSFILMEWVQSPIH
jgi:hypothetical protein